MKETSEWHYLILATGAIIGVIVSLVGVLALIVSTAWIAVIGTVTALQSDVPTEQGVSSHSTPAIVFYVGFSLAFVGFMMSRVFSKRASSIMSRMQTERPTLRSSCEYLD